MLTIMIPIDENRRIDIAATAVAPAVSISIVEEGVCSADLRITDPGTAAAALDALTRAMNFAGWRPDWQLHEAGSVGQIIKDRHQTDGEFRDALAQEGLLHWEQDVTVEEASKMLGVHDFLLERLLPVSVQNGQRLCKLRHVLVLKEEKSNNVGSRL